MKKPICVCGFFIGVVLLALAAVLILHADSSASGHTSRLRLERAVSELDGCLTCHAEPATARAAQDEQPVLVLHHVSYPLTIDLRQTTHTTVSTVPLPDAARADMHDIGQRILDLPVTDPAQVETVTADFLAVYDSVQAATTADELAGALSALENVERLLRELEYQAHPVQWTAAASPDQAPDTVIATASHNAPVPVAFAVPVVAVESVAYQGEFLHNDDAHIAALLKVHDMQRRGPPATVDNPYLFPLVG